MKKLFKFSLMVVILTILCIYPTFAQEVITADTPATSPVKDWIVNNWYLVLPIIYDLLVRLFPTGKSYSIISFVYSLIKKFVPDHKLGGGIHS